MRYFLAPIIYSFSLNCERAVEKNVKICPTFEKSNVTLWHDFSKRNLNFLDKKNIYQSTSSIQEAKILNIFVHHLSFVLFVFCQLLEKHTSSRLFRPTAKKLRGCEQKKRPREIQQTARLSRVYHRLRGRIFIQRKPTTL